MDDAYLEFVRAGVAQTFSLVGDRVTVGRAETNGLCLATDAAVSREHAVLERAADGWRLCDAGSRTGCYVNGKRLSAPRLLRPADQIVVGRTQLRFGVRARGDGPGRTRPAEYLDVTEEWEVPAPPVPKVRPTPEAQPAPAPGAPPRPSGRWAPPSAAPVDPLGQLRRRGYARVRGEARGVQYRPGDQGQILTLRIERYDSAGNRLSPVAVELRAHRTGHLGEGEQVEAIGKWSHGTLRATKLINLTTHAEVQGGLSNGEKVASAIGITFFALFFLFILAGIVGAIVLG